MCAQPVCTSCAAHASTAAKGCATSQPAVQAAQQLPVQGTAEQGCNSWLSSGEKERCIGRCARCARSMQWAHARQPNGQACLAIPACHSSNAPVEPDISTRSLYPSFLAAAGCPTSNCVSAAASWNRRPAVAPGFGRSVGRRMRCPRLLRLVQLPTFPGRASACLPTRFAVVPPRGIPANVSWPAVTASLLIKVVLCGILSEAQPLGSAAPMVGTNVRSRLLPFSSGKAVCSCSREST